MRVFLDTNVLVSAFATRGLCADVLRYVLAEHELVIGDVVLVELRSVLRKKLDLPAEIVNDVESMLRDHEVVPKPTRAPRVELRDSDDGWIVASAVAGRADVLVTGDRDLLDAADRSPLPVLDPRAFWEFARKSSPSSG